MNSLTVKIPAEMDSALLAATKRQRLSKSELVRRAVASYLAHGALAGRASALPSALELAGDLVGCFGAGPADLSSNPRHLDGFGRR